MRKLRFKNVLGSNCTNSYKVCKNGNFDFDPSPKGRGGADGLDFCFGFCARNLVSGSDPGKVCFGGWGVAMVITHILQIIPYVPTTNGNVVLYAQ